jgi:hypothetical protein
LANVRVLPHELVEWVTIGNKIAIHFKDKKSFLFAFPEAFQNLNQVRVEEIDKS